MKEILQVPATINKIETMADRSLKLILRTQELNPEDKATLFGMEKDLGWFVFSPQTLKAEDVPTEEIKEIKEFPEQKSDSKRLYDVLFVQWKNNLTETQREAYTFDEYRKIKMSRIIQNEKDQIKED